ncbi:hypothetical protein GCM10009821_13620 [Aeromicrobium halocynthiae]|uniref:Uncharacterized protein n=2 Tax=Aeromicrobium halocynthiae TaxID=560557 RepID=A0ABN2VY04_9ACTN
MSVMTKRPLAVAGALVAVGIVVVLLQPGPPEAECVPEGTPSSGFVDSDRDCPISQESWAEISEWRSLPKPFRILGALLVLAGVVMAGVAVVVGRRRGDAEASGP